MVTHVRFKSTFKNLGMKILIFGASGSGTTTLGNELAKKSSFIHLDIDDYYWKPTEPPFQKKIPLEVRNKKLTHDFYKYEDAVISGSMVSWGKEWETAFDLGIFIRLDNDIRINRLTKREHERYGDLLYTNEQIKENSKAFLDWANQYENPNFSGRSLKVHIEWLEKLNCPVLEIDGQLDLMIKTKLLLGKIEDLS